MEPDKSTHDGAPNLSQQDVQKIFKSFDKDSSGTIEIHEIAAVVKEMGETMTEKELAKVVKEMDLNGDGKISFSEFYYWWRYSRQGKLKKVVGLKFKALKLIGQANKKLTSAGVDLKENYTPETSAHELSISLGDGTGNVQAGIELYLLGQLYHKRLEELKKLVPDLNDKEITVIMHMDSKDAQAGKTECDALLEQFSKEASTQVGTPNAFLFEIFKLIKFRAIATNKDLLVVGVPNSAEPLLESEVFNAMTAIIDAVGKDFSFKISANVKLKGSISQAFGSQKFVKWLAKGFSLKFKVETNEGFLRKIRKILEQSINATHIDKLFMTLLKYTKLNLKLKSAEDIDAAFQSLGIGELAEQSPMFGELFQQFSADMDTASWKDPTNAFNSVYRILSFINSNIEDKLVLEVVVPGAIAKLHLRAVGGSKLFENAFKSKPATTSPS